MADFLRSKCHLVLFHWRNNTKIALYPLGVVIVNVILNHPNKLLLGSKPLAIISLALQDAPESLHWAIVNQPTMVQKSLKKFPRKGHKSATSTLDKWKMRFLHLASSYRLTRGRIHDKPYIVSCGLKGDSTMSVKYTPPAQHKSNLRNVYGTFAIEGI